MKRFGRSQQAVYDYVAMNPGKTTEQIGLALYDKTSSCSGMARDMNKDVLMTAWARRILSSLKKKGLVANEDGWKLKQNAPLDW